MIPDCRFCYILKERKQPIIYENPWFFSIYDTSPVRPGNALVIPKRHVISRFDLNFLEKILLESSIKKTCENLFNRNMEKLYCQMIDYSPDTTQKIKDILDSPYLHQTTNQFNLGNNEGIAAGRTIHHFHYHIIPRFSGDIDNPEGGLRKAIK